MGRYYSTKYSVVLTLLRPCLYSVDGRARRWPRERELRRRLFFRRRQSPVDEEPLRRQSEALLGSECPGSGPGRIGSRARERGPIPPEHGVLGLPSQFRAAEDACTRLPRCNYITYSRPPLLPSQGSGTAAWRAVLSERTELNRYLRTEY